jgi:hypothetical protein
MMCRLTPCLFLLESRVLEVLVLLLCLKPPPLPPDSVDCSFEVQDDDGRLAWK